MGKFNRDRGNRNRDRRGGGFNRRDHRGGDRQMHKVICDNCHKECEVPFKPSNDKPIYCNECFAKQRRGRSNDGRGNSQAHFETKNSEQTAKFHEEIMKSIRDLNYKLDELVKTLNSQGSKEKKVVAKKTIPKKTTTKKKPTAKKKK